MVDDSERADSSIPGLGPATAMLDCVSGGNALKGFEDSSFCKASQRCLSFSLASTSSDCFFFSCSFGERVLDFGGPSSNLVNAHRAKQRGTTTSAQLAIRFTQFGTISGVTVVSLLQKNRVKWLQFL
jgi:hypothetical protein